MNIFSLHINFRSLLAAVIFYCLNIFSLSAQEIPKDIISTAGQFEQSSQIELQWTLGEISIDQHIINNIGIDEGFHSGGVFKTSTSVQTTPILKYKIYPNPTNEVIFIESKRLVDNYNYSVFNVYGYMVLNGSNTKRSSINLKTLSPGLYIIRIENSKGYIFSGMISKI